MSATTPTHPAAPLPAAPLPAAWAVQLALYGALEAAPGLAGVSLHDDVPADPAFPCLTIGEARCADYPGVPGAREHEVRIHAYSRWGGRAELKRVEGAVRDALHDADLVLVDHRLAQCRHVFSDVIRRPDQDTYHAVMRFRLVTEPLPEPAAEGATA